MFENPIDIVPPMVEQREDERPTAGGVFPRDPGRRPQDPKDRRTLLDVSHMPLPCERLASVESDSIVKPSSDL